MDTIKIGEALELESTNVSIRIKESIDEGTVFDKNGIPIDGFTRLLQLDTYDEKGSYAVINCSINSSELRKISKWAKKMAQIVEERDKQVEKTNI